MQRVDALIYAVVMESRGIYMSPDVSTAKVYGEGLLAFNDRITQVVKEWRISVREEDAALFEPFAKRLQRSRTSAASWCGVACRLVQRPGANGATTTPTAPSGRR